MPLHKRLLILFLAVWLPVSAAAAGSMAVSMSGAATQEAAVEAGEGCPQHSWEATSPGVTDDCYSCSFCHFVCAVLIANTPQPRAPAGGWIAAEFVPPARSACVLDRLHRPPLDL